MTKNHVKIHFAPVFENYQTQQVTAGKYIMNRLLCVYVIIRCQLSPRVALPGLLNNRSEPWRTHPPPHTPAHLKSDSQTKSSPFIHLTFS